MYNNKKTGKLGIIITVVILILLVMLTNVKSNQVYTIGNIVNKLVSPVQQGITYLKHKISGNNTYFTDLEQLREENNKLKEENSKLEQAQREYEIIKTENETLKSYLGLTEKYSSYRTVPAYVINKDISNYSKTIVINAGKDDGITENMPVIANDGLVGYVISVTNNTAKVQTIVDSSSSTSSLTSSTRDNMICKGTIEESNILKGTYIANDANIIEGDSIETSGMGGIYPKGIHIGTIKEVTNGKNKTDISVKVEVAVDFNKLETVLVITK